MLLAAVAYVVVGVGFAGLDKSTAADRIRFWRLAAWVASAAVAAAQLGYEHYRRRSAPLATALHAAAAVALGACGLALGAILHSLQGAAPVRRSLVISLVAWPAITAVPAFLAALLIASVLTRFSRRP